MTGDPGCEQIGAVNIDAPKLLHPVIGVGNCVEVLGETSGGNQVVNFAVILDDVLDGIIDGVWIGDIGVVSCDFGNSM